LIDKNHLQLTRLGRKRHQLLYDPELINPYHCRQRRLCAISVNGRTRGKIKMQRFDFLVEDGFRDADRTVRNGLSQTAASDKPQATSAPPASYI
jgi:hypothetical protein